MPESIWDAVGPIATDKPDNLNLTAYRPAAPVDGVTKAEAINFVTWVNATFSAITVGAVYAVAAAPGQGNYILPPTILPDDEKLNYYAELVHTNGARKLVNIGKQLFNLSAGRLSAAYRLAQMVDEVAFTNSTVPVAQDPTITVVGAAKEASQAIETWAAAQIRSVLGIKRKSKEKGV